MLEGNFSESSGEITFPDLQGAVLEKAVQYMYYKVRWASSSKPPPEFDVETDLLVDLLLAANYLGI